MRQNTSAGKIVTFFVPTEMSGIRKECNLELVPVFLLNGAGTLMLLNKSVKGLQKANRL